MQWFSFDLHTGAAGEYFGELALIDGGLRSASVASLAPCEFFVLERETFLSLLTQSPQLLATTLANLSQAVRATSERVFREALQQQAIRTEMELARYRSLAQMVAGVAHEINTPRGTVNTATSVVKGRLNAPVFAPLAGDPKARAVPNLHIPQSGELVVEVLNPAFTLEQGKPNSVFGPNRTAIVIYAGVDDYKTDPAGNAGGRIACGVIK